MKIILYINSRIYGGGRQGEYICTSDSSCYKFFTDRMVDLRYAIVYLKESGTGYCHHCIEKFIAHLRALKDNGASEAHVFIGHFRNERTRKSIRMFLHAILRSAEIIEDPDPEPDWMNDAPDNYDDDDDDEEV